MYLPQIGERIRINRGATVGSWDLKTGEAHTLYGHRGAKIFVKVTAICTDSQGRTWICFGRGKNMRCVLA